MMNRRSFTQMGLMAAALPMVGKSFAAKGRRPNLMFIVTDEHNLRTLGCYREQLSKDQAEIWGPGNVVETPHIDSIAKHGTLFNRMYASTPTCTPARCSMFTGYYGAQQGMPNNSTKVGDGKYLGADVPTIAQVLRDAGYMTGYCGKWHLAEHSGLKTLFWKPYPVGHEGYNYGFTDNRYMFNSGHHKYHGIDDSGAPYRAHRSPQKIGTDAAGQPVYKDRRSGNVKFTTDWLTDRTIEFIDENKDKPFYYVCSIPDPHSPDIVREPYISMYKDMKFELPRTFHTSRSDDLPSWQRADGKAKAEDLQQRLTHYFGMVKCIDDNVGRIVQKLEDEGVLEDTLLVFSADHGDLMFEHGRLNKGTIHETSARVPFLIAHGRDLKNPIVPRGKVVNQAANTCDWMPTFLSLLNVPCPGGEGRDLTPLLAKEAPADWKDLTFSIKHYSAAIDGRYKLHANPYDNEPWLFDIVADPDEVINFIDDPAYKDVVQRLAAELKTFMKHTEPDNKKGLAMVEAILKG